MFVYYNTKKVKVSSKARNEGKLMDSLENLVYFDLIGRKRNFCNLVKSLESILLGCTWKDRVNGTRYR